MDNFSYCDQILSSIAIAVRMGRYVSLININPSAFKMKEDAQERQTNTVIDFPITWKQMKPA